MAMHDDQLKHLEFLQTAIGRMATSSFLFKGWAITIAAGLSAVGAVDTEAALFAIGALSTLLFWGLDGYYLWLERGFVKIYNEVSTSTVHASWAMSIDKTHALRRWLRTCIRPHLVAFYAAIISIELIAVLLTKGKS